MYSIKSFKPRFCQANIKDCTSVSSFCYCSADLMDLIFCIIKHENMINNVCRHLLEFSDITWRIQLIMTSELHENIYIHKSQGCCKHALHNQTSKINKNNRKYFRWEHLLLYVEQSSLLYKWKTQCVIQINTSTPTTAFKNWKLHLLSAFIKTDKW